MNRLSKDPTSKDINAGCADLVTMAEQELSAFFRAVTELFGSREAELSADDWLYELTALDRLPASIPDLRRITAKASTRLAGRLEGSTLLTAARASSN